MKDKFTGWNKISLDTLQKHLIYLNIINAFKKISAKSSFQPKNIYKQNWHYTIKNFEHQARAVLYNIPWHAARELCNGPRNEILD